MSKVTDGLVGVLTSAAAADVGKVLEEKKADMFPMERPFSGYFKELLRIHGLTQNAVIEKAGFSMQYGYRLLSEERRTKQRDYILRFCIAAGLDPEETRRCLQLYGLAPLYARIPRDAVIIAAMARGATEISEVDDQLKRSGFEILRCSEA